MNKLFKKNIISYLTENSVFCSYTAFGSAIAASIAGGKTHIECLLPIPFCERLNSLVRLLNGKFSVNYPMLHLFKSDRNKNQPDPFTQMIENITRIVASGEYEFIAITDFYPVFETGVFLKEQINELIGLVNGKTTLILTGRTQHFDDTIGEKIFFTSNPDNISLPCHIWINGPKKEKQLLCLGLTSLSAISGITTTCSASIYDGIQLEFLSKINPKIEFISPKEQLRHNMVIFEESFKPDEKNTENKNAYHIEIKNIRRNP